MEEYKKECGVTTRIPNDRTAFELRVRVTEFVGFLQVADIFYSLFLRIQLFLIQGNEIFHMFIIAHLKVFFSSLSIIKDNKK